MTQWTRKFSTGIEMLREPCGMCLKTGVRLNEGKQILAAPIVFGHIIDTLRLNFWCLGVSNHGKLFVKNFRHRSFLETWQVEAPFVEKLGCHSLRKFLLPSFLVIPLAHSTFNPLSKAAKSASTKQSWSICSLFIMQVLMRCMFFTSWNRRSQESHC